MSRVRFPPPAPLVSFLLEPKRDTKSVRDRSEAHVIAALTEAGYGVAIPFGENHRYDLIADDGARLLRVQARGGASRPYFGQIDLLAVYCPQNRKVYLLPESELVASNAYLRVAPTKNGMSKRIRWADRFELP